MCKNTPPLWLEPPSFVYHNKFLVQNSMTNYSVTCLTAWFATHLWREYRERTTPLRILLPYNLSSCRVVHCLPILFTVWTNGVVVKMFLEQWRPMNLNKMPKIGSTNKKIQNWKVLTTSANTAKLFTLLFWCNTESRCSCLKKKELLP